VIQEFQRRDGPSEVVIKVNREILPVHTIGIEAAEGS
jgi:hypothetical protein